MDDNFALKNSSRPISNRHKNTRVRVVTYSRVSTQHEAQINAFDNQKDFYLDVLRKHPNWELVGEYSDKGVSGTQAVKRVGFMKMIDEASQYKFDLIITREVSRMARNTVDSLEYTRKLRSLGVEVYFVNDDIWSLENDGELRLAIMSAMSQEESAKVSSRVLSGQQISREHHILYGNGNILGYKFIKGIKSSDNTYEIIEEDAETIRMIFDMYVNKRMGAKAIATEMQKLGRKNASGICRWDATRILRVIKNRTYAGYLSYNKSYTVDFIEHNRKAVKDMNQHIYIKGNFPPIISDEIYNKAQAVRCGKLNHDGTGGKMISNDKWSRKLHCSCGCTYKKFLWRKNKEGIASYGYVCWNIVNNKSKSFREENGLDTEGYCNTNSICDWKMELMAKTMLERIWKNPQNTVTVLVEEIADNYSDTNDVLDVEKAKLIREQERINCRLESLLDMRLDGAIDNDSYELKHKQLKERIEQIGEELRKNAENVEKKMVETKEDVSSAMVRIKKVLEETCDLSQKEVNAKLIDNLIRRVVSDETGAYKWYVKGESDDEETEFNAENYVLYDSFTIDFETARAYRKSFGNYLRKNQYQDLQVEVYVRK